MGILVDTLRSVRTIAARTRDPNVLLRDAVELVAADLKLDFACIIETDGTRVLRVAAAGELERAEAAERVLELGALPSCVAEVWRSGKRVLHPSRADACPHCVATTGAVLGEMVVTVPLAWGESRWGALVCLLPFVSVADPEQLVVLHEVAGEIARSLRDLEREGALRDAEERLHELAESEGPRGVQATALAAAANGVVITDREGIILSVNPALCRLSGYDESELIGRRVGIFGSRSHGDTFYRDLWGTIRAGGVWHGELKNRRKDGSTYMEEMTITPVRDRSGVTTHYIAIKQDISDRQEAAAALASSEERYRTLVDNIDSIIFSTDIEGRLSFVNVAVGRLGYRPEQVIGTPISSVVHPDDLPLIERITIASRNGAVHTGIELRLLDVAGKVRYVRASTRPIRGGGEIVGVTGICDDVTVQRDTEEQLRVAQRMEAVGRLAGGVAHDFNNLLSVVLSYTEIAMESLRTDDPLRSDLDEALRAARRAEGLTRQLLAFSRKQVLLSEAIELNELTAGLARMLERLIGEDVRLEIAPGRDLHPVRADRGQLEQVVMNLVVNARDAMPDGGRLLLSTQNVTLDVDRALMLDVEPGEYVELLVRDTGCGMTEETRKHVFEPFFTTKDVGKGTGLGLSTAYGIVRQSGGAIDVTSALGEGSTFRVYLKVATEHASAVHAVPRLSLDPSKGTETILVVEDEAALRAVVRRVLGAVGYRVVEAADAEEALAIHEHRAEEIALVLTDVVMPGMHGRELADRLAASRPNLPVVFMSGYTDEAIERHGVLSAYFLRKPFDREALTRIVRVALDERASAPLQTGHFPARIASS